MSELDDLITDLLAEQTALDDVVSSIGDEQWRLATASPGWNVADQVSHVAFFDAAAATAILDPERFTRQTEEMYAALAHSSIDDYTLAQYRSMSSAEILATWQEHRRTLATAARSLNSQSRVAWYGPSMSARSFLSARLMEVWAHGTDAVDALGATRRATDRLRHIARLGYITRGWSYVVRGEEPPLGDVRLELTSPSEATWTWGPDDADDTVRGPAEDFCLVVTQRRHVDDTSLVTGALARHWLLRAQVFAGSPSTGPEPRSRHEPR